MKRWSAGILGLSFVLVMAAGCAKQCFLAEKDFNGAHTLPHDVEPENPYLSVDPSLETVAAPPTVDYPDRPAWNMSLQEAIAIALENGLVSSGGGLGQGIANDNPYVFQGGSLNLQSDRLRVLALQPAIAGAQIEAALARFDAQWINALNWTATDNLQQGLSSFNNGLSSAFTTGLAKGLPTGGVATVAFNQAYTLLQNPPTGFFGVLNPNYTSRLVFAFEQPLIKNFGVDINQVLSRFPTASGITGPIGTLGTNFLTGQFNAEVANATSNLGEGILLTRLRFDQQRAEFERQMHILLLNAEVAYWRLYQAYGELYANEEVLRITHKSWMINKAKFVAGTINPANFYPFRAQYEEFRGNRLASLGSVLEKERNLRRILGLPVEDGKRIVPFTPPTLAPYQPNWEAALADALAIRPDMILARENLRAHQLNLVAQKNFLKPDLRLNAYYSPVGFGTQLDGNGTFVDGGGNLRTSNSLRSLAGDHFNDWQVGLTMNMPLGFRLEQANVRTARLQLAQAYYLLKDQEDRVKSLLTLQYEKVTEWYRLIEARRAERVAYTEAVKARFQEMVAGKAVASDFLLDSMRRQATAQIKEYEAMAEYNNSLIRFEWAKGTIMQHDNVIIAESGLPQCAQVRAVEHERERSKALILRHRPDPLTTPGPLAVDADLPQQLEPNPVPDLGQPEGPGMVPTEPKKISDQGQEKPAAAQTTPVVLEAEEVPAGKYKTDSEVPAFKSVPAAPPANTTPPPTTFTPAKTALPGPVLPATPPGLPGFPGPTAPAAAPPRPVTPPALRPRPANPTSPADFPMLPATPPLPIFPATPPLPGSNDAGS